MEGIFHNKEISVNDKWSSLKNSFNTRIRWLDNFVTDNVEKQSRIFFQIIVLSFNIWKRDAQP